MSVDSQQTFPATHGQQGLWLLDQLDPGRPIFNVPLELELDGPLSVPCLQSSLNALVVRHESLRTIFRSKGGLPYQVVVEPAPVTLSYNDFERHDAQEQRSRIDALRALSMSTRFDLSRGPLITATLARKSVDRHVLLIVMHHIITDGWSLTILRRDLLAFYRAAIRRRPVELADLAIQFGDFAVHQRRWLEDGGALEKLTDYWRQALDGVPPPIDLPTTLRSAPEPTYRSATLRTTLGAGTLAELEKCARGLRSTPFCLLATALFIALNRYTGSRDLVVGTPMAGRDQVEIEDLVGFFVNDVLLRYRLDGSPTFGQAVTELDGIILGARQHQGFPFLKLVELVRPAEGLSHDPLFQVWFAYHHFPSMADRAGDLSVRARPVDKTANWTGVAVEFTRHTETLELAVTYAVERYDGAFIEQFTKHYMAIVEAALASPHGAIDKLEMLSSEEQDRLIASGRGPVHEIGHATVVERFRRSAALRPTAIALRVGDTTLTYSELSRRVDEIAGHLALPPGGIVAVALPRGVDLVATLLAVLASGCAYLPLDAGYPTDRLAFMLRDSGAELMVTHSALAGTLPAFSHKLLIDRLGEMEAGAAPLPKGPGPDHTAYVIYTSGSTGTPKGVVISHRALTNLLLAIEINPGFDSADQFLALTTISFDIATLELFLPLVTGGTLIMARDVEARDPNALIELLASTCPTVMQATPSTWRMLIDSGWEGRRGLRAWCGGERLPTSLASDLLTRVDSLFNMYGPTETTIWSAAAESLGTGTYNGSEPLGGILANTQIVILDERGRLVPRGVDGEIHIGGSGLAAGYHGRADLTAQRFVALDLPKNGGERIFYKTGDRGRWIDRERFAFGSRLDRQVKLRGVRIELGEIEAALMASGLFKEAIADVFDNSAGSQFLVAYVVPKAPTPVDENALDEHLRKMLPQQCVPNKIVSLDAIPRTNNAKVNHAALPRPVEAPRVARVAGDRDDVTERIRTIWVKLLGNSSFDVNDNFFRIGGHSLIASRMIHDLGQAFSFKAPLRLAYEAPTVAALARRVKEMAGPG